MLATPDVQTSGNTFAVVRRLLEPGDQLVLRQRAGVEELLHQLLVGFGDHLDRALRARRWPRRSCRRGRRLRSSCPSRRSANVYAFIATRSTTPLKSLSSPIGSWIGTMARPHDCRSDSSDRSSDARSRSRRLRTTMRGSSSSCGRGPGLFGLHLDAGDGVDDQQRGVGHAHRGARVAEEIAEARACR